MMSNHVKCPYLGSGLVQLPCRFIAHPHKKDMMFCSSCGGNQYDIHDIGNDFPKGIKLLTILSVLLLGLIALNHPSNNTQEQMIPIETENKESLINLKEWIGLNIW